MRARVAIVVALLLASVSGLTGLSASAAPESPREITVATREVAPFVMTRDGVKTGFAVDLLDLIAKRAGWTITYLDTGATNSTEQLTTVTDGRADAAVGSISITAERRKSFDFSQPILNSGLQIAVPIGRDKPIAPGLTDFLKLLFSSTMLVWLGVALVLTVIPAHITWLLERRHPQSMVSKSYFPGVFQAFRWSLGMLAAQPDDAPRHRPAAWHCCGRSSASFSSRTTPRS